MYQPGWTRWTQKDERGRGPTLVKLERVFTNLAICFTLKFWFITSCEGRVHVQHYSFIRAQSVNGLSNANNKTDARDRHATLHLYIFHKTERVLSGKQCRWCPFQRMLPVNIGRESTAFAKMDLFFFPQMNISLATQCFYWCAQFSILEKAILQNMNFCTFFSLCKSCWYKRMRAQ